MPTLKINNLEGTLEEVTELSPTKDYQYPEKNPGVFRTELKIYGQPPIIFYKRINPKLKGKKVKINETTLNKETEQILRYKEKTLIVNVFKVR